MLKETRKKACRTNTPIDANTKLESVEQDVIEDKEKYQRLVNKLMYLSHNNAIIQFFLNLREWCEEKRGSGMRKKGTEEVRNEWKWKQFRLKEMKKKYIKVFLL